ncbi:MAG: hypothetical protein WD275_01050 [Rhodothermales bacterium]
MSKIFLSSLFLVFALAACDTTSRQDEFAEEASGVPAGIARTTEGGEIISDDKDDWRTAPVFGGKISLRPAYPNPVPVEGFMTVPLTITAFREVQAPLTVKVPRDGLLFTLDVINQAAEPGAYIFQFAAAHIGTRGLRRLFIFDGTGELVSYGDVQVE